VVQKSLQVTEFFSRLEHPPITSRGCDIHDPERAGYPPCPWALDHILGGVPLEKLAVADFAWQPGWEYRLPA
jgi:hypothetical protein